jgi:hypothetical protein
MKRTLTTLGALMATTTQALAFGGPETADTDLWTILFIGFGALIIACQLVPGVILFGSALKTLFRKVGNEATPAAHK